jgi:transcriptional regulator with XRE-family HTH domain
MKEQHLTRSRAAARNIRLVRGFRKYTQDYLAMKLGISQNAYSKIELGYSKITLERLFHIAILLEIDATVLLSIDTKEILDIFSARTKQEDNNH